MEEKEIIDLILKDAVQVFSEDSLRARLTSGQPLKIKLGADPSRPDLHLGHTVVLRKLRLFQLLGHEIIFVIGDFTGMIGDPTGRSKTRPSLTMEETRKSGESYFRQVSKILDPLKTRIVYNSQWLGKLTFSDVISLAGKYTVARMLERDDFKNRFENNIPISLHELLYPLAQGYDSVALAADVEVGGTDQTFNLLVGRALQSDYGQKPQEVITYPLLVGLDGKDKMSKSLDNYIGIDEPADVMFEKAMRVPDEILASYFALTTDMDVPAAQKLIAEDIRGAHFLYAQTITIMYHDADSAAQAKARYLRIAGGALPDTIPVFEILSSDRADNTISITDLMIQVGFASSKGDARRKITGRGVKINQSTVEDPAGRIDLSEPFVLQFGKNSYIKICRRQV